MTTSETLSIAASIVSIALAVFAIWSADQQRRESQANFTNTKDVLSKIEKVMEKTEMLVSQNFQNLLQNVTEQQNKMLESMLTPRPTERERITDLLVKLASDEPEKLNAVAEALAKLNQPAQQANNPFMDFLKLAQEASSKNTEQP